MEIKLHPRLKYWFIMNLPHFAMIVFLFFASSYKIPFFDFDLRPIGGILSLLLIALSAWNYIVLQQITYIIQDEQVIVKRGVIRKTTNYMEMYRIFDYQKTRNIVEVALGLMNVVILSRDLSNPTLTLFGLENDDKLILEIRKRVEYQKKIKNIFEINNPR